MNGPDWLGSWEGQSISDICSGLTKVNAIHWDMDYKACEDLVDRKVHSSLIGFSVIFGAVVAYASISACMNAAFFSYMVK